MRISDKGTTLRPHSRFGDLDIYVTLLLGYHYVFHKSRFRNPQNLKTIVQIFKQSVFK